MSIVKVIEVISEGKTIEDAIQSAVKEASRSLYNIKQFNVEHVEALIEDNKVSKYRVNGKLSFLIDPNADKD